MKRKITLTFSTCNKCPFMVVNSSLEYTCDTHHCSKVMDDDDCTGSGKWLNDLNIIPDWCPLPIDNE